MTPILKLLLLLGARPSAAAPVVPLSFVGSAVGGNSVVMPAHQAGDLIIAFAFRVGSTTPPTLPAGWTSIASRPASDFSTAGSRLSYRVAVDGATPSGTWTNATDMAVVVLRGAAVGASASSGLSFDPDVRYPALTMQVGTGTSWVLCFSGAVATDTALETPPAGTVVRAVRVGTGEIAAFDTNGGVSSWANHDVTIGGTTDDCITYSLEIKAA